MAKKQILLLSSSRLHGFEFLEHAKEEIDNLLKRNNVKNVLFIPFAQKDHDSYANTVREPFQKWGYNVESLHTKTNQKDVIKNAESIFIGGGNSFVLLKTLLDNNLIESIREAVLNNGTPYIGSSAGTNVATISIKTTNDMPIVYPSTFNALNLVPFNINPHYIETNLINTKHKGETRDQRIQEFLEYNDVPVVGLREGTSLFVDGNQMILQGKFHCRLFQRNTEAKEYPVGSDLSFLLNVETTSQ